MIFAKLPGLELPPVELAALRALPVFPQVADTFELTERRAALCALMHALGIRLDEDTSLALRGTVGARWRTHARFDADGRRTACEGGDTGWTSPPTWPVSQHGCFVARRTRSRRCVSTPPNSCPSRCPL